MNSTKQELAHLDQTISDMRDRYEGKLLPNWKPETSRQMRQRADQRRSIANQVRLTGGRTKPDYTYEEQ